MSFKNARRDSLFCNSSPQISSVSHKEDSDNSDRKSDSVKEDKSSDNMTDSDSLKLVMTDSASDESDDKKKTAMNENQDDDDASSDDTVIMDLDGQSGHEPKLADTQILIDTQVITDINDNTQIVLEPPKSPNQKLSYCSRRHNQSQLTNMTTIVTVHPSESSVVYQKMEKCSIAVCNDEVTPLRCGPKKSPSHKRKTLQSSQVLEDNMSTQEVPKKPKDESPDLLYPTPPEQSIKRRRKTPVGANQSQDCCPLCGKNMSLKALLQHSLYCNGVINTRATSSLSTRS